MGRAGKKKLTKESEYVEPEVIESPERVYMSDMEVEEPTEKPISFENFVFQKQSFKPSIFPKSIPAKVMEEVSTIQTSSAKKSAINESKLPNQSESTRQSKQRPSVGSNKLQVENNDSSLSESDEADDVYVEGEDVENEQDETDLTNSRTKKQNKSNIVKKLKKSADSKRSSNESTATGKVKKGKQNKAMMDERVLQEFQKVIFEALCDPQERKVTKVSLRKAANNLKLTNISDEQIFEMINVLNEELYKENIDESLLFESIDGNHLNEIITASNFKFSTS